LIAQPSARGRSKLRPYVESETAPSLRNVLVTETIALSAQAAAGASQVRLSAIVLGYAATEALVLTAMGLYGLLAFSVSRRTKEIGVRMALGAESARVRRMILRQGMAVCGAGAAVGLMLAAGSTGLVNHLLYGPPAADLRLYAAAGLLVAGVGLLACWFPARRAAPRASSPSQRCEASDQQLLKDLVSPQRTPRTQRN